MGRRKKESTIVGPRPNDTWEYITEMQINGRYVTKGTELKIAGERGRFRFMHCVKTEKSEWIDVWGGPKGAECQRSFKIDQVKTVHYKNVTGANLLKASKAGKLKAKEQEENVEEDDD